jgi:hypothetical protein
MIDLFTYYYWSGPAVWVHTEGSFASVFLRLSDYSPNDGVIRASLAVLLKGQTVNTRVFFSSTRIVKDHVN